MAHQDGPRALWEIENTHGTRQSYEQRVSATVRTACLGRETKTSPEQLSTTKCLCGSVVAALGPTSEAVLVMLVPEQIAHNYNIM